MGVAVGVGGEVDVEVWVGDGLGLGVGVRGAGRSAIIAITQLLGLYCRSPGSLTEVPTFQEAEVLGTLPG